MAARSAVRCGYRVGADQHLACYPPLGSTIAVHSAVPLPGRDIVVINSEALREECDEPASYAATVDISDDSDPILAAGVAAQPLTGWTPCDRFPSRGWQRGLHLDMTCAPAL